MPHNQAAAAALPSLPKTLRSSPSLGAHLWLELGKARHLPRVRQTDEVAEAIAQYLGLANSSSDYTCKP